MLGGLLSPVTGLIGGDGEKPDKEKKENAAAPAKQTVVGTIRFSYEGFVLIYTPVRLNIPAGTKATTVGKDGIPQDVELRISEQRKNTFLVADVVSGSPKAGQIVMATLSNSKPANAAPEYQVLP